MRSTSMQVAASAKSSSGSLTTTTMAAPLPMPTWTISMSILVRISCQSPAVVTGRAGAITASCLAGNEPQEAIVGLRGDDQRLQGSTRVATVKQSSELRRMSDLTVIYGAFHARMPGVAPAQSGLERVAELCRRHCSTLSGRDRNLIRDQLFAIAADWDLRRDRLNEQSSKCLHVLAEFWR